MKQLMITTLLFSLNVSIFSQWNLSGTIISQEEGPIEFATISIYPKLDSTNIQGITSNPKGTFHFKDLEEGEYIAVVQMLGFGDWEKEISLNKNFDLGRIYLKEESTLLNEVKVVAEQSVLTNRLGKKVLNIGKDLSAIGSNALEALDNIPSVTTSQRGVVQIRGNSNVIIYINGKETRRDPATLKYISAESLEKIEVITNPSAKYDAEGIGGIINLVYKNEKNGQFKLESITNVTMLTNPINWNPNGGLNLSWSKNKLSINSNFSIDYGRYNDYFDSYRNNFNDSLVRYENDIDYLGIGKTGNFNLGISFDPDTTFSLGFEMNFDRWDFNDESLQQNTFEYQNEFNRSFEFSSERGELENELWINFSLEKKLKQKRKLKFQLTLGGEDEQNFNQSNEINLNEIPSEAEQFLLSSDEKEAQRYYQGRVFYEAPFFKFGNIETGTEVDFIEYNIIQKAVLQQENISPPNNDFTMNMQKIDFYFLQKHQIKKLEYAIGARVEHFSSKAIQRANDQEFTQRYLRLFPSVQFNFLLPDPTHTIGFNYTRRINRPGFFDLNPFVNYSDPLNLRTGNPSLAPEIANLFEVSYHRGFDQFSYDLTLYRRITKDAIQLIVQPNGNNQTLAIPFNFLKEKSQGLEAQLEYKMNKIFKTSASFVFGQMKFEDLENQITFNNNKSWNARTRQQFRLSEYWKIEIDGVYQAPRFSAQRKIREYFYLNFGLNKKFKNGKGSIALRVTDISNSRQYAFSLRTSTFEVGEVNKWQTRQITFGLRYYLINRKG